MGSGKHSSSGGYDIDRSPSEDLFEYEPEKKNSKMKIIIIVFVVILALGGGAAGVYFGMNMLKGSDTNENPKTSVTATPTATATSTPTADPNAMPDKLGSYNVLGKLVIEKIKLEQYILDKTEEEALKQGLTKLYGNGLNKAGNLTITGHNTEKMFKDLDKLEKDDTFNLIDKSGTKGTYKVTDILTVEPDDLTPLLSNNQEKEVTLITCKEGSTKRLVVKAKVISGNSNSKTN